MELCVSGKAAGKANVLVPLVLGTAETVRALGDKSLKGQDRAEHIGRSAGGATGAIIGGVIGSFAGPLGSIAGAVAGDYIGRLLGKKAGGSIYGATQNLSERALLGGEYNKDLRTSPVASQYTPLLAQMAELRSEKPTPAPVFNTSINIEESPEGYSYGIKNFYNGSLMSAETGHARRSLLP